MDASNDLIDGVDHYKHTEVFLTPQLTFPAYTAGAAAFFGSFFLIFYLGTGFTSGPLSFLVAWADRPERMREDEFKRKKESLAHTIEKQLKKGKDIYKRRI